MSERRTAVKRMRRAGLIVGVLLASMMVRPVAAEGLFTFPDEDSLAKSMGRITDALDHEVDPTDACRFDILSDLRGHEMFDTATLQSMDQALATGILGADRVDGCDIRSLAVGQDEIAGYLTEQGRAGDLGLTLALTYYRLGQGLTLFATLRNEEGSILGSTGRVDLPVVIAADVAGAGSTETTDGVAAAVETAPSVPPAPATKPEPVVAKPETSTLRDAVLPEATIRRQLAAETRLAETPTRPFNLRRIQAGIPSSIKTLRVVDAGGSDTLLLTHLGEHFLDGLKPASSSSVETSDGGTNGRPATEVTIEGEPDAPVETVEIQVADDSTAFEQILDNQADILVTRQPISSSDAAVFAEAYGVNMRSRYAERVVAIAANETGSLACGIRYPDDDMLMSTEDHPTSERVYIYVNPSVPSPARDQFIDFALSAEGQEVVAGHAIDLRLRLSDAGYAAWRYQAAGDQEAELLDVRERFRDLIRTSQRVSSTFRFDFASADLVLDSRSEQDLENLIDLVKAREIDSRRILLFGFADSSGPAAFNADLSRSRADAVATRLRLAGVPVPPRNVHGIGEDSPVACNTLSDGDRDELGARKNRRVEVWIES